MIFLVDGESRQRVVERGGQAAGERCGERRAEGTRGWSRRQGETPRAVEQDREPHVYPSDAWSHIEEFQAANNVMPFGFEKVHMGCRGGEKREEDTPMSSRVRGGVGRGGWE